jgi:hypothetical protein
MYLRGTKKVKWKGKMSFYLSHVQLRTEQNLQHLEHLEKPRAVLILPNWITLSQRPGYHFLRVAAGYFYGTRPNLAAVG